MLTYETISITNLAPDETGYLINGTQHCAVRLSRAAGAAASMFGFTACAFALESDGLPTLTAMAGSIEGWFTVSCPKADLLVAGNLSMVKIDELKDQALIGAMVQMMSLIAQESAFAALNV